MTIQEFREYMASGQGYQSDRNLISMKLLLKILTIFVALSNIFFVLGVVEVVCACLNLRIFFPLRPTARQAGQSVFASVTPKYGNLPDSCLQY